MRVSSQDRASFGSDLDLSVSDMIINLTLAMPLSASHRNHPLLGETQCFLVSTIHEGVVHLSESSDQIEPKLTVYY